MAPNVNSQFGALPTFPAAPPVDPRVAARDAIARFLGQPTGNAQSAVQELTDVEAAEVADAAGDRYTARREIKAVLTRAYDRRRVAAQREAGEKGEFLRRRGLAQRVLEQALHLHVAAAADVAHRLSPDDQQRLADLAGQEDDVAEQAQAILDDADRAAAAQEPGARNQEPDEPTDVIPGGSTPIVSPETQAAAAATDEPPAADLSQAAESDPATPAKPAKAKHKRPATAPGG